MKDKVFLTGNCRECGVVVQGWSTKATIKQQGLNRMKNRLCPDCKRIDDKKRRGKSTTEMLEERDMAACGCRMLRRDEIEALNYSICE